MFVSLADNTFIYCLTSKVIMFCFKYTQTQHKVHRDFFLNVLSVVLVS